jgi:nicotinate-nucleotide adenylyltransferase
MNIGLFGGTFDPIHRGHIALAQAAGEQCGLKQVLFVPANVPPHKQNQPLASFFDRYAMVVLATAHEKTFLPSALEAPGVTGAAAAPGKGARHKNHDAPSDANYSIDTVRRFKKALRKSDRLFFLIGIDAFRDIAKWREPEALFRECEFIVASRPGYSLADVANALPEKLRPAPEVTKPFQKQAATGDLVLPGVMVHLLQGVNQDVSATAIREAASKGKSLARYVDPGVAEYIKKMGLYKSHAGTGL